MPAAITCHAHTGTALTWLHQCDVGLCQPQPSQRLFAVCLVLCDTEHCERLGREAPAVAGRRTFLWRSFCCLALIRAAVRCGASPAVRTGAVPCGAALLGHGAHVIRGMRPVARAGACTSADAIDAGRQFGLNAFRGGNALAGSRCRRHSSGSSAASGVRRLREPVGPGRLSGGVHVSRQWWRACQQVGMGSCNESAPAHGWQASDLNYTQQSQREHSRGLSHDTGTAHAATDHKRSSKQKRAVHGLTVSANKGPPDRVTPPTYMVPELRSLCHDSGLHAVSLAADRERFRPRRPHQLPVDAQQESVKRTASSRHEQQGPSNATGSHPAGTQGRASLGLALPHPLGHTVIACHRAQRGLV